MKQRLMGLGFLFLFVGVWVCPLMGTSVKTVTAEEFTATWCGYCPYAAKALENLKVTYGARLAVIAYHPSSSDPFYIADSATRNTYYGISGYPTTMFDGVTKEEGGYTGTQADYKAAIDARLAIASPLDIALTASPTGGSAVIKNISPSSISGKVQFCMIERNIPYSWQTESKLDFVARKMYPNASGQSITLAAGASTTFSCTYTLGTSWVQSNCYLIVFVQASDKTILQAQESPLTTVPSAITITAPNGGEVWNAGSSQQITWTTTGISSGDVTLDYTTNNGTSWTAIGTPAYNASPFTWDVPATPSVSCKVRATQGSVTDSSNAVFTIIASPVYDFDIDGSGQVNFSDVSLLGNMLAGTQVLNGKQDVNKDGVFDATDVAFELAKIAGLF